MASILRVGLTGGIGSGKSTVCRMFADLGAPVIDADTIAHYLTRPGQPALQLIRQALGPDVITDAGTLDRPRLRKLVFSNDTARIALEKILHPMIYAEIEDRVMSLHSPYCIISIPLLVEKRASARVDRVLVIDAPEELQMARAGQRDHTSREDIATIMRSQTTRANRLAVADDIIHNDGSLESLHKQVHTMHESYIKIAGAGGNKPPDGN